jgi:hypothetical protein
MRWKMRVSERMFGRVNPFRNIIVTKKSAPDY